MGRPSDGPSGEPSAGTLVLDASCVLAVLHGEPGAEKVERRLEAAGAGALIGAVNLSEVVGKLAERGVPEPEIREAVGSLALGVAPFDEEASFACGMLRPGTKERGLSLGDRACVAQARLLSKPGTRSTALTMERRWEGLEGVEVVPRPNAADGG